ncbi:MAG: calcium-binding protein [Pseudomonadota bacterium]
MSGIGGKDTASDKLRNMIAYSAIDAGTTVFGDTAIRALYDDANDLGKFIAGDGSPLAGMAEDISKVFVEYAGMLAIKKVPQSGHASVLEGVLDYSTGDDSLTVDFTGSHWNIDGSYTIASREALFNDLTSGTGLSGVTKDEVGRMILHIGSDRVTIADMSPADAASSAPYTLFAGATGQDVVTGSSGKDVLLGNGGNDTLDGNGGNDVLYGGADDDFLAGGAGVDTMTGGAGDDTYEVDNAADAVTESSGEGWDTVQSGISYTLGENVEVLELTGSAVCGIGNSLGNIIIGSGGNNGLDGDSGADVLYGKGGTDVLYGLGTK